jgi:hypothetical protein
MAERRMFALKIIDSDAFLDMPKSSQSLYFHLSMRADDDGFISNPKKIMRMIGSSDDDMKILLAKRFLLSFDTGIVVIKHWRIHNYIAKDRYAETIYKEEKDKLFIKANGSYTDHDTLCIQDEYTGKVSLGELSLDKESKEDAPEVSTIPSKPKQTRKKKEPEEKKCYGTFKNVFLSDTNYSSLKEAYTETVLLAAIEAVSVYVQGKPNKHYDDFNKVLLNWGIDAGKEYIQAGKYRPSEPSSLKTKIPCPRCGAEVIAGLCTKCRTPVDSDGKELK